MVVPSCSVCVVSELAVAENGAPLTTFPGFNPSNPINSIRSANGPPGPRPGGGGGCCARNVPAVSSRAPPTSEQAQILRFIVSSPLLSCGSKLVPQEFTRALLRLRQPHCFGQSVLANQQIHLNPVAHPLFIHRQTQCAECAALHSHPYDGGIVRVLWQAVGQQRKVAGFVVGDQRRLLGRVRLQRGRSQHICLQSNSSRNVGLLSLREFPIPPAHAGEQPGGGCEHPSRKDRRGARPRRAVPHAKFLS